MHSRSSQTPKNLRDELLVESPFSAVLSNTLPTESWTGGAIRIVFEPGDRGILAVYPKPEHKVNG